MIAARWTKDAKALRRAGGLSLAIALSWQLFVPESPGQWSMIAHGIRGMLLGISLVMNLRALRAGRNGGRPAQTAAQ